MMILSIGEGICNGVLKDGKVDETMLGAYYLLLKQFAEGSREIKSE